MLRLAASLLALPVSAQADSSLDYELEVLDFIEGRRTHLGEAPDDDSGEDDEIESERRCKEGDAKSCAEAGLAYAQGLVVQEDKAKAAALYK